ncbi:MAG: DUF6458 family protein [Streptosporangiales bacterium]|nr:DUF6458 family protein [Streptosporangiales bacterium]
MRTGAGLALICVGAILAFAVTAHASVINVQAVGWILMLTGLIGLVIPRRAYGWLGRRLLVRRTRSGTEEIPVPPYLARNPGTSRTRAGMTPKPVLANDPYAKPKDVDPDSEVIEDLYEQ